MSFKVRFSAEARADLVRLHGFLLERATSIEDLDLAEQAVDEVELSCSVSLARTPYIFRKAGSTLRRELVIPFGATGYVALYQILDAENVLVLAVRHQLEDDFQ